MRRSRTHAAHVASDLFLALPRTRARDLQLTSGANVTLAADRPAQAEALAREAGRNGAPTAAVAACHLTALARQDRLDEFVALARADLGSAPR